MATRKKYPRTVTFRKKKRKGKKKGSAQAAKALKRADRLLIEGKARTRSAALKRAWREVKRG